MTLRAAKILLVAAIAFFYTLVVFNNCTDYGSNYQFVHHVLLMDSTIPGNHGMWRAIHPIWVQETFYDSIILWEVITMVLCWMGCIKMLHSLRGSADAFHLSKRAAIIGMALSLLMWLVAFLTVGAEWFLMWQSHLWNGQEAAFRMFAVIGIVLILVALPEREVQP
jgi:predicted small integral membrane protein